MLTLRSYKAEDAKAIASWFENKDVFLWWSAGNLGEYPLAPQTLDAFFAPHIAAGEWFPKTMEDDGQVAGSMLMRWKEKEEGWLHFGYIVVDRSKRGKGYGSAMLNLALEHAFQTLGASRVTLTVFEVNSPAIRCYERMGFARVGEWVMEIAGKEMRAFSYEKRAENA